MRHLLKKSIVLLALPIILSVETSNAAQEEPAGKLDPTVVSATLSEQKLSKVPFSAQVIDQTQIEEMGADTVAQVLQEAVGMVLETESGRAARPSIRGTGPLHTLVLIDGRRLAPGYRGMTDINQIPSTMIERVEVVRGPSSSLFGSDAMGGVINIITKKPPRKKTVAGVDIKGGTNTIDGGDTFLPQAYVGSDFDPFRFIVGGSYRSRGGWEYDAEPPDDGDDLKQQYASGQAAIDFNPNHTISFGGYYNNFKRNGQRDIQNTLTERDATDESNEIFVRYDGSLADKFNVMLQAYRTEYKIDVDLTPATSDPYFQTKEKYELTQYEGRLTAKINQYANATFGAEYRDNHRGADNLSPEYDTSNKAGFGQLDMLFFNRLNLVAGLRWDDHSEFGSELSPRIAASFIMNEHLQIKGSYGHGFRAPIPYELYVTSYKRRGKDIYLANSDLQPETSQSYEFGLQSNLDVAKGLSLELTYFNIEIDDMIEAVLQSSDKKGSTYKYENISEAKNSGLEFLGSLRLPCGWKLGAGGTYLDSKNKETGHQLTNQPEFKGNLNAEWHIEKLALKARLSYTWYSGREDGSGNSLDDYSTLDAWLGKDLFDNMKIYAGMKNILDDESADYNIQPAFVYLGVKWSY